MHPEELADDLLDRLHAEIQFFGPAGENANRQVLDQMRPIVVEFLASLARRQLQTA